MRNTLAVINLKALPREMTLNIRYGNGAAVVVRGRESRPHGEGRQLVILTTEKGRCVIHHEKSNQFVKQFAEPQ
ncbi:MAG TPA: hypothetical protein VHP38_03440 [Ruminiclostridium sp.]|nr:hypothetical protein [Ruminiclostridium sp.]